MAARSQVPSLIAGCSFLALATAGSTSAEAASVEEMQRLIENQQAQIAAQQAQLDAQKELLEQLQSQVQSLAAGAAPAAPEAPPPASPPRAEPAEETASLLVKRPEATGRPAQGPRMLDTQSSHDLESPTGSNVSPNRPALSLEVPEISTKLSIFGFTQFQIAYDTNFLDASEFDVFLLDVEKSNSGTTFSVNPSRFGFGSETNLGFGRVNTLLTVDFNGELDEPSPRLRQAYGEFIHDDLDFAVLAGQAYTTGLDLKAAPETLDFAGPSGAFARRQPLLRFSKLFGREWFLDIAAETPQNATFSNAETKTRLPDFYVAGEWDARSTYLDHVRVVGLVRDLNAEDEVGNSDGGLGWAIGASTKLKLPFFDERDNLKLSAQYGEGYGAALKSGPFDGGIDPTTGKFETVPLFSAFGGLQHFWTDEIRSNAVFGYVNADLPTFFEGERLDENIYAAANIIWEPLPSLQLGFEYLYGHRKNFDGKSGDGHRLLFSSKWTF